MPADAADAAGSREPIARDRQRGISSSMVRFTLNGAPVAAEGGRSLLSFLRDEARLTSAKNGCGEGACGACSVIVDGAPRSSCSMQLERLEGKTVLTLEGISEPEMDCYERAFAEAGAVQCGFCTPGMVIAAKALLDGKPDPRRAGGESRVTEESLPLHRVRQDRRRRAPGSALSQSAGVGGACRRAGGTGGAARGGRGEASPGRGRGKDTGQGTLRGRPDGTGDAVRRGPEISAPPREAHFP